MQKRDWIKFAGLVAGIVYSSTLLAVESYSDVIAVSPKHLSADYWIEKEQDKSLLLNQQSIDKFTHQLTKENRYLYAPLNTKEQITGKEVKKIIGGISKPSKYDRFYPDGRKLTAKDYQPYITNLALNEIPAQVAVKFALVAKRTPLRMLPTMDRVLNDGMDKDLDRFQETAVFPGDELAVLHQSKDKKWYFVRHYHYQAWVQAKDIAIGPRQVINEYKNAKEFLLISGAKVFTVYNPDSPQTSEVQLEMGSKFPLMNNKEVAHKLKGQNPYAGHIIKLPVANNKGQLEFQPALVAGHNDVADNYLPFNKDNLLSQSFKFLGERYGWGHDYNGRDCTGFVGEIYKSFGFKLPRNSGQQGSGNYGHSIDFAKDASNDEKLKEINKLQVGDLIYIPGHVMMYIGNDNGQPYVIHDVKGLSYRNQHGQFYRGTLNGVSVTPLLPLQLNKKKSYLDAIYNIKRIR